MSKIDNRVFETNILLGESVFFTEGDRAEIFELCWEAFHESCGQSRDEFDAEFNRRWLVGYSMDSAIDLAYLGGIDAGRFTASALARIEASKNELDAKLGKHDWEQGKLLANVDEDEREDRAAKNDLYNHRLCADCGAKINPDEAAYIWAAEPIYCKACEGVYLKDCVWVGNAPPTPDQIRALQSRHYRHRHVEFNSVQGVLDAANGADLIVAADIPILMVGDLIRAKQSNQTIIAPIMEWPHWEAGRPKPVAKIWSGQWEEILLVSVVTRNWA